jgi:hypothetical protein
VVWAQSLPQQAELGLEITEASKDFYDILPRILPEE